MQPFVTLSPLIKRKLQIFDILLPPARLKLLTIGSEGKRSITELTLLAWKVLDKMDIINIIWHDFFEEGKGASIYSILWGYS